MILIVALVWPCVAMADEEARSIALGSASKCAQSWNSTIAIDVGNSYGWHQTTAPDKPCLFDASIEFLFPHEDSIDPVSATSGTYPAVFAALPAAHTNTRVLVLPEGYSNQAEGGYTFSGSQLRTQGRWAYRWYVYYSSNYASYAFPAGPCTNSSKWATIQTSYIQMSHQADLTTPQVYGWAVPPDQYAWQPDVSVCCWFGPGYDPAAAADGALPGSWWRYEIVGHGMDGTPGAYLKVYRKNITSGASEKKIVDTTIDCIDCDGGTWDWPSTAKTALESPDGMDMVTSNFYRAGTCAGYIATAYQLAAQWDTDSGQRIGAATEIEGSGGGAVGGDLLISQRYDTGSLVDWICELGGGAHDRYQTGECIDWLRSGRGGAHDTDSDGGGVARGGVDRGRLGDQFAARVSVKRDWGDRRRPPGRLDLGGGPLRVGGRGGGTGWMDVKHPNVPHVHTVLNPN